MQHHGYSPTLGMQFLRQVQHLNLVRDVQVGGRLIEQNQRGLLRQGHGNPHTLTLTTRKRLNGTLSKLQHVRRLHRLHTGALVLIRPGTQQRLVRVAAARHHIRHGHAARRLRGLRQHRQDLGDSAGLHLRQRGAVQANLALLERVHAGKSLQGGRLTAGVRAQDNGQLPLRHLKIYPVEHRMLTVGNHHVLAFKAGRHTSVH